MPAADEKVFLTGVDCKRLKSIAGAEGVGREGDERLGSLEEKKVEDSEAGCLNCSSCTGFWCWIGRS